MKISYLLFATILLLIPCFGKAQKLDLGTCNQRFEGKHKVQNNYCTFEYLSEMRQDILLMHECGDCMNRPDKEKPVKAEIFILKNRSKIFSKSVLLESDTVKINWLKDSVKTLIRQGKFDGPKETFFKLMISFSNYRSNTVITTQVRYKGLAGYQKALSAFENKQYEEFLSLYDELRFETRELKLMQLIALYNAQRDQEFFKLFKKNPNVELNSEHSDWVDAELREESSKSFDSLFNEFNACLAMYVTGRTPDLLESENYKGVVRMASNLLNTRFKTNDKTYNALYTEAVVSYFYALQELHKKKEIREMKDAKSFLDHADQSDDRIKALLKKIYKE